MIGRDTVLVPGMEVKWNNESFVNANAMSDNSDWENSIICTINTNPQSHIYKIEYDNYVTFIDKTYCKMEFLLKYGEIINSPAKTPDPITKSKPRLDMINFEDT